ncbi:MAG: type I pantothenate kinase [Buchnera aphidicola (Meitanaphis flavogallis)]
MHLNVEIKFFMMIFTLNSNINHVLHFLVKDIMCHDLIYAKNFKKKHKKPYIIGISGSVASGKSTISQWLRIILQQYFIKKTVSVINTDSFLYPNKVLNTLGLMTQKGFPITYNIDFLVRFFLDVKSGMSNMIIPVYSHFFYDIIPDFHRVVYSSDIFIIEGLHILYPFLYKRKDLSYLSNIFNFSIYIDANDTSLIRWYLSRFLKLRYMSQFYSNSFFNDYSKMSYTEVINSAMEIWYNINYKNLKKHISPTRRYADCIIKKRYNHSIDFVQFKNNS